MVREAHHGLEHVVHPPHHEPEARCGPPPEAPRRAAGGRCPHRARRSPTNGHVRVNIRITQNVCLYRHTFELKATKSTSSLCHKSIWHERVQQHGKRCLKRKKKTPKFFPPAAKRTQFPQIVFAYGETWCGAQKQMCGKPHKIASGGWCAARNSDEVCAPAQHCTT